MFTVLLKIKRSEESDPQGVMLFLGHYTLNLAPTEVDLSQRYGLPTFKAHLETDENVALLCSTGYIARHDDVAKAKEFEQDLYDAVDNAQRYWITAQSWHDTTDTYYPGQRSK